MESINVFICNQTYLLLYNYSTDVKGGQVFAKCLQSLSSIGINYEWNPFDLLINYCVTFTANVVCIHYVHVFASLGSTVYNIPYLFIHCICQQYNKQNIHTP